jgi:flagellar hook protein FlgE
MTFNTTAEKGAADSVNIFVPQPSSEMLKFSTSVNGEDFEITGAVNKGATHSTNIIIHDSLGGKHGLVTTWEHTNKDTQEWKYKLSYSDDDPEIVAWLRDPANNIADPEKPTEDDLERANDVLLINREGTMYFHENGKADLGRSFIPEVKLQPEGSNPLSIKLDQELVTQFDSGFTTKAEYQDGYEMGLLEQIYFEEDGVIRGVYSNGQKQPIGQMALTTFNNPGGLEKLGKNLYEFSPNSGQPVVGKPGMMDRGVIVPASLEMSNVDISEEFTTMIITQRAFQANSRVITTSDELLQEVVNLKR